MQNNGISNFTMVKNLKYRLEDVMLLTLFIIDFDFFLFSVLSQKMLQKLRRLINVGSITVELLTCFL